jgi:glycosyltransferase involved in cell wall biosynthesis
MNILYCKNSFAGQISGADEITVNYAIEMKAAGHSTAVLLVHQPPLGDGLTARLGAAGVPLSALASQTMSASLAVGRRFAIRAMRAFPPGSLMIRTNSRKLVFSLLQRYHHACCEYLTSHRPDVVHVMTPDPGAVMFIRAAHAVGIPVVYQEVGIPFHPPGFEEVYERFITALPLCSDVAALSPSLALELSRAVPHCPTPRVLPLISDGVTYGPLTNRNGDDSVCFGFAARLEYLKGPLQLVEAHRIAHLMNPKIKVEIAGEGSQRGDIILALRRLGLEENCRLVGTYKTLEERSRFMQHIDVFVLPSLTEGTPNAVIEAMAHGKPVIATNVGGIPDFITEDVGMLVAPGDTRALGTAMARLASDEGRRTRMGRAARKKYERLFSAQAVQPLLVDFYQRVLGGQHSSDGVMAQRAAGMTHPWADSSQTPQNGLEPQRVNQVI